MAIVLTVLAFTVLPLLLVFRILYLYVFLPVVSFVRYHFAT